MHTLKQYLSAWLHWKTEDVACQFGELCCALQEQLDEEKHMQVNQAVSQS